jgi:hypothetical protein
MIEATTTLTPTGGNFVTQNQGVRRKVIVIPSILKMGSGEIPTRLRDNIGASQPFLAVNPKAGVANL